MYAVPRPGPYGTAPMARSTNLQNQEHVKDPAIELEFWMISVRGTKVAIIKVVMMVWMLQILTRCHSDVQEWVWVNDMKKGGLNMEVSQEYNLYENEERDVFFGLLGGLAKLAGDAKAPKVSKDEG
ncbi:hypothetical protein FPQ18DRAFT_382798 [Pyronema domesticum]|nr:hypothetical protein FPQ18DRAFT_382798 [Pyronema domesticum]